jgi:hypothetical protein
MEPKSRSLTPVRNGRDRVRDDTKSEDPPSKSEDGAPCRRGVVWASWVMRQLCQGPSTTVGMTARAEGEEAKGNEHPRTEEAEWRAELAATKSGRFGLKTVRYICVSVAIAYNFGLCCDAAIVDAVFGPPVAFLKGRAAFLPVCVCRFF